MADFTLNTSVLGGGQFSTRAFDMNGPFREIQFRFSNSTVSQDAEPHYFEFHFTWGTVSMEDL